MPELNAWRWEDYAPDIGDNCAQTKPFVLRVKSGLTLTVFADWLGRLKAASASLESLTALLGEVMELGPEPLTVDGVPIRTLGEYVALVANIAGSSENELAELLRVVREYNSTAGRKALFSARRSGGKAITPSASPEAHAL